MPSEPLCCREAQGRNKPQTHPSSKPTPGRAQAASRLASAWGCAQRLGESPLVTPPHISAAWQLLHGSH